MRVEREVGIDGNPWMDRRARDEARAEGRKFLFRNRGKIISPLESE